MKKINSWFILSLLALVTICMGSCSDDEPIVPVYPEIQTIEFTSEKTAELKFTANTAWTLSSGATWCKFANGEFEDATISGNEGDIKVTIKLVEENPSFKADQTELKLRMADDVNGHVIAKVIRPAKERVLELFKKEDANADGKFEFVPAKTIELGLGNQITYKVKANYNFVGKFSEADAENIDLRIPKKGAFVGEKVESIAAEANTEVEFMIRVKPQSDAEKYPVSLEDNKVMEFIDDEDPTAKMSIKYSFAGLEPDFMEFEYLNHNINSPWGWVVDMQGTMFKAGGLMGGAPQPVDSQIMCKIKTLKDEFKLAVIVDMGENAPIVRRYQNTNNEWSINASLVEGKKDEVIIKATAGNKESTYIVMAIPAAQAKDLENLSSKELGKLINDGNYVIMEVNQKDEAKAGIDVANNKLLEFSAAEDITGNSDVINALSAFIPDLTEETPLFSTSIDTAEPFSFVAKIPGWTFGMLELYNEKGEMLEANMEAGLIPGSETDMYIQLNNISKGTSIVRLTGETLVPGEGMITKTLAILHIWAE